MIPAPLPVRVWTGLTAGDIAMALSEFCPQAGPEDLEAYGRLVLAEVYSALLRGHLVCVAERSPDGPRTVLVLNPREGLGSREGVGPGRS